MSNQSTILHDSKVTRPSKGVGFVLAALLFRIDFDATELASRGREITRHPGSSRIGIQTPDRSEWVTELVTESL